MGERDAVPDKKPMPVWQSVLGLLALPFFGIGVAIGVETWPIKEGITTTWYLLDQWAGPRPGRKSDDG